MDVGTAKPTPAEQRRVPHHLLDLVAPDQAFTAAEWVRLARRLIVEIAARGRLPLVVGGTGLYVSALVHGFRFGAHPGSGEIRARLEAELTARGIGALGERLRAMAPEVAARTDLRNPRRVLRALERAEAGDLGPPGSDPYVGQVTLIGLERPPQVLEAAIAARAARLFRDGLLEETAALLAAGYAPDLPALSGHGYREAARHLAGEGSLEEAIATTTLRTRQYARRQRTWFRREPEIRWLDLGDGAAGERSVVERALRLLEAPPAEVGE
jgi:tRNA dimethylallyltransferase